MKQRINSGVEIQVLQITHKLNWALAVGKGIWQLHEVKKKSFDLVDIRTQAFRITVFGYFWTTDYATSPGRSQSWVIKELDRCEER